MFDVGNQWEGLFGKSYLNVKRSLGRLCMFSAVSRSYNLPFMSFDFASVRCNFSSNRVSICGR